MKLSLTIVLSTLMLAAPALAEPAQVYPIQPVGKGDPNAVSCYQARMPTKHLECARNSQWARINRQVGNVPNTSRDHLR
jgi:hypothetical protein